MPLWHKMFYYHFLIHKIKINSYLFGSTNNTLQACVKGANGITRATPTYLSIIFVIAFGEIFLEYSWNIP